MYLKLQDILSPQKEASMVRVINFITKESFYLIIKFSDKTKNFNSVDWRKHDKLFF